MRLSVFLAVAMAMAFAASAANAGDRAVASSVRFETGVRYWYSTGKYDKLLFYDEGPASDLLYDHLDGQTGEIYFRADVDPGGWFVKGNAGAGSIDRGSLTDEDFPPGITYSKTWSPQHGGDLSYATIDVGFDFERSKTFDFGLFGGYNYYHEVMAVFGCTQVGDAGSTVCVPAIDEKIPSIEEHAEWHSLRLGLSGRARPFDRLTVDVDAAFLYSFFSGTDYHLLRPDLRPSPEVGWGPGLQFETVASYRLTDKLSLGLGARIWRFSSRGYAKFPSDDSNGKIKIDSQRLGLFVQLGLAL